MVDLTNTEIDENTRLHGESVADIVLGQPFDKNSCASSYETFHAVISKNYRYIYTENEKLEELYDLNSDPDEHTNIAYYKEMRDVIVEHRVLLHEYTGVTPPSSFDVPHGFMQLPDETIRRKDYQDLSDIIYKIPNWWSEAEKETARIRLRKNGTQFIEGFDQ